MSLMNSKGQQITDSSFQIIHDRLGDFQAVPTVMEIVVRIAHTTGDVEFGTTHVIPEEAVARGIAALRSGCSIITDVEMVRTGVRKALADQLGCPVRCFLNDPEVVAQAKDEGTTKSEMGMQHALPYLDNAVVAIGNAPTALFKLLELIKEGKANPAVIVGVPVGFVGALESKQALYDSGYPGITNLSERGGSPIAAAIVNGLLHLAVQKD